ncbi:MAG: hypothetical protein H0T42_33650, partial [Deltaproteobacteria bacterium]|nr:hypothetical protein [Deltaproteobacteria bacterium]
MWKLILLLLGLATVSLTFALAAHRAYTETSAYEDAVPCAEGFHDCLQVRQAQVVELRATRRSRSSEYVVIVKVDGQPNPAEVSVQRRLFERFTANTPT